MRFAKTLFFIGLFSTAGLKAQFQVSATVDHIIPWSADTVGNIVHSVSGGSTPYTYTWTPGPSYSKDLTNVPANSYSFVAMETGGGVINKIYNLGYKTRWINHYGTIFRNDTLLSDGTSGYSNRCALSKNTLPAYTDGWVEYVHKSSTTAYVVGFLDSASLASRSTGYDYDFSFHSNGGNLYAFVQGSFYWLGYANDGDVFAVERVGSVYNLKVNSVITFTDTAPANRKLKVKGQLYSDPLANIGVSFDDSSSIEKLRINNVYIDHLKTDDIDSLGSIYPDISGGQSPYQYSWTPGSFSSMNLTDESKNNYSFKVKDANNDSIIKNYNLGYKINWTDIYGSGATFLHDTLRADAASSSTGLSSAVSINELRPGLNGWVQHVIQDFASPFVVGFSDSIIPAYQGTINDMNVAFHESYGSNLYSWYSGYWSWLGTVEQGDIVSLSREGSSYYIKKNGSTVFTGTADSTKNLRAKATINDNYFLANIGASFADSTSSYGLNVNAYIDHIRADGIDSLGNIRIIVSGGKSPYTYKWTPGNITNKHLLNAHANLYTLRVKDYNADSIFYYYNLGYNTHFTNFYRTLYSNDSLFSDGTGPSGNRSALSLNMMKPGEDGWSELVVQPLVTPYLIGFLDSASAASVGDPYDIDFAFHISYGDNLYAWSSGYFSWLGYASKGDVIRLERSSNTYYLKKNSITLYTDVADTRQSLWIKGLINDDPIARYGSSSDNSLFSTGVASNIYAILKRKLDATYYNSVKVAPNNIFYFKFDEEYYVPGSTNLTYKIYNDIGTLVTTTPALIKVIGDNRFGLNVSTLTSGSFYKVYVYNEKNEVWKCRLKVK